LFDFAGHVIELKAARRRVARAAAMEKEGLSTLEV